MSSNNNPLPHRSVPVLGTNPALRSGTPQDPSASLMSAPWYLYFQNLKNAAGTPGPPGPPGPSGSGLSLETFGARGDLQYCQVAIASGSTTVNWVSGATFSSADVGKRIVFYGGGSGGNRESWQASADSAINTVDTYTATSAIDAQNATQLKVAVNCEQNDVTWELFGATLADYSDEVVISGPTDVTALAASSLYTTSSPGKRYYRTKIKNKNTGQNALAYCTCVTLGRMLGTTIATVVSSTVVTVTATPSSARDIAYCYFGTDDTAAIQSAFDILTALVPGTTANGGSALQEVSQKKYLISSSIEQKWCVTLNGVSGGGTIFQCDGESFPTGEAAWNMTGVFTSGARIAFYTRLQDVRIDCGHVPGSIGIFCDALQENSGLYRCTVINWVQYGIQASSNSDRYGCTNWIVQDPWVYPSDTAFADDTVAAYISNFALFTTIIRGTFLGQGGFICGYGKGLDISNGTVNAVGEIHNESARIGFHFNSGSGGLLDGQSTQSTVQTAVLLEGGNPTIVRAIYSSSQTSLNDTESVYATTQPTISEYVFSPITQPTVMGTSLTMPGTNTAPNVVTWNNINFSNPGQGGYFSVNSYTTGYPNWVKSSSNASNTAMFLRLGSNEIEVRIGPAVQPVYVAQGVCNVSGTAVTWVSGATFNTGWAAGSQILLNNAVAAKIASVGSTTSLTLQATAGTLTGVPFGVTTDLTAFGGTDPGVMVFKGTLTEFLTSPPIYPQAVDTNTSGIYAGTGSPETVITATPGSLFLRWDGGANTSVYRKESGSGNTGWVAISNSLTPSGSAGGDLGSTYPNPTVVAAHFPAWTAYTPTVTLGATHTVTTLVAAYLQLGKLVHVRIHCLFNVSASPSSPITFTLPASAVGTSQAWQTLTAMMVQAPGGYFDLPTTSFISSAAPTGVAVYVPSVLGGGFPVGDNEVIVQGSYEAA
jgi:hypothetical protein